MSRVADSRRRLHDLADATATALMRDARRVSKALAAESGAVKLIVPEAEPDQAWPRWSADGRRILYWDGHEYSLRIFDVDTRKITTLPGSRGLWWAEWSPDGRYIAAVQGSPPTELKAFDLQTQHWSTVLAHKGVLQFPSVSQNGRSIYVLNGYGPYSIYRVPILGGKPELIAELRDIDLTGYSDGTWFGLDPQDNPLLLRNTGSSAIYALTFDRKQRMTWDQHIQHYFDAALSGDLAEVFLRTSRQETPKLHEKRRLVS